MSGISLYRNKTYVFEFVCSALATTLFLVPPAMSAQTTLVGAPSAKEQYESDQKRWQDTCNLEKEAYEANNKEKSSTTPFNMSNCLLRERRGGDGGSGTAACTSATSRMQEAREKYLEKCSDAGLEGAGCYAKAKTCQDASLKEITDMSYEDNEDLDEDDLKDLCEDRYKSCPALAALDSNGITERQKDAKEGQRDEQDIVFDLEERLRDEQQAIMDAQNDVTQLMVKSQQAETKAIRELEKMAIQAESDKVAKLTSLRAAYEKIDEAYLQLRNELNKATVSLNMQMDEVQLACEKKADEVYMRLLAKRKSGKAAGTNNQGSVTRLAGADRRRSREVRAEYQRCMNMKSTRSKLARIEEMRTVELKRALDRQTDLEQKRANMIQSMNETEILAALARETATKQMAEQVKESKQETATAVQQAQQAMMTKQQSVQNLQQRLSEAKNELKTAKFEKKVLDRDKKCANKFASRVRTSSDKDINFASAVSALTSFEAACSTYKNACSNIPGVTVESCDGEARTFRSAPGKANKAD